MLNLILETLKKENIAVWKVKKTLRERAELYFIRKQLDMPRYAVVPEYEVSVYRDFEENGKAMRGLSVCYVDEGQTQEEISAKIQAAYYAAQFVKNPFYELADAICEPYKESTSNLRGMDIKSAASALADAFLSIEDDGIAFVNSLEIFVRRTEVEIIASTGLHVSFGSDKIDGEFVTQCVNPIDVEQYRQFSYDNLDAEALKQKIATAIEDVRRRANAKVAPKTGTYNILLTGENVATFLEYYCMRSHASVIFPGYSTWKKGDKVQKDGSGEKLNLDLVATTPYSADGVAMKDLPLLRDGVLQNIFGPTRFMRYLGEQPTGDFTKLRVEGGSMKFEDMKSEGTLETVSFSDFQMNAFTGNFGGEMRLCLLRENGKDIPLTGGSINGKMQDVEDKLIFSTEKYEDGSYCGPYAVLIPNVPVAGI